VKRLIPLFWMLAKTGMRGGAQRGQLKIKNGHAALEAFDVTIMG